MGTGFELGSPRGLGNRDALGWGSSLIRLWGFGVALFGGLGAARRPEVSPPFLCCFSKQQPQFLGERPFSGYSRSCPLPCLPCLYTTCAKEPLRPTVGLLCLCQGLWIRTRQVLSCPRAGTRWRTFRTQRYSKALPPLSVYHSCVRAIAANGRAVVPVPGPMDPDPTGA